MKRRARSSGRARVRAFSLLELTLVLAILGVLMAAAALSFGGFLGRGKARTTQVTLNTIKTALETYQGEQNVLPPDLQTLVKAKYLSAEKKLADAWERPLIYIVPGPAERPYVLMSTGEDGKAGTEDDLDAWKVGNP